MEYFKLTAAMHNLGCKVNAYEADAMLEELRRAGIRIVPWESAAADIYIINTCSVTNIADRKSRQMIHKARSMNPAAVVIAAGCYVQARAAELQMDTAVDILVGNQEKGRLLSILEAYWTTHPDRLPASLRASGADADERHVYTDPEVRVPAASSVDAAADRTAVIDQAQADRSNAACFVSDIAEPQPYAKLRAGEIADQGRVFIKVQDGCNQFCSYCIIPYARGRVRSRRFENVIAEVERLAANGFKEVVLTGIHLSSYGVDFEEATGLLELIQAVNAVKGIERIRLGSLEPKIVTEHFASELSKLDKICPHFHLSLQSGCDATLKRMNRKYTTKEYERGCELLRKYFVHPAITTDVIVGFPGETEEEFEQTKAYLEHIHFYEMHIFKYSKRKGTRAAVMPDQIDEQIKAARSEKLIALGHDMSKEFRKFYIGKNEEVLFEEKAVIGDKEYFVGYTKEYVKVAKKTAENLENQIVSGRISGMLTDEILLFE